MPIFEFECKSCGAAFNAWVSSSKRRGKCPMCYAYCRKIISLPAVQYKGEGFHTTDYIKRPTKVKE